MKKFGRHDVILFCIVGVSAILLLAVYVFFPRNVAEQVVITVDGAVYGTYDLTENQKISVVIDDELTNIVEIYDGKAFMVRAECPDHLCIKQGKISFEGETVVCLPNRVIVQVKTADDAVFDSMTK